MSRRLSLPLLLALLLPATALAGPPWITIELPANPWDVSTRGAFLVVHAYHHGLPMGAPLTGTADGVVHGQRKHITLAFEPAGRAGVYALRKQWEDGGRWVLRLTVSQGDHGDGGVAEALVVIAEDGSVSGVTVPTSAEHGGRFPRRVTQAEIDAALRGPR